jgi:AAA15 family ATPase/GTPase
MLIEFRVENHRSIRDEQVLTMEAGRVGDATDPRPRTVKGHNEKLLPAAAIYGANASGKSNVLSALAWMRDAVVVSHRFWTPDGGVPRNPFAWGADLLKDSLFEASLLLGATKYQYGFVASSDAIEEEWLHAWPRGKKQVWFTRADGKFKFGAHLKGENRLIAGITRQNALFLSVAAQHRHEQLTPHFNWFQSLRPLNVKSHHFKQRALYQNEAMARFLHEHTIGLRQKLLFYGGSDNEKVLETFRELLGSADFGIVDVKVDWVENEDSSRATRIPRFRFKHQAHDDNAWLPLEEESRGTQTFFGLAMPVLMAIQRGTGLVVDELESSLHPALAQRIVGLFNNPISNPKNAQLIFATHDTNLLGNSDGEPVLRRDQVWLTEKDREGATVLYPLTDFQPRKSENLELGYLLGRYGAIPFLGEFNFLGK